jgi:hypothetical protein
MARGARARESNEPCKWRMKMVVTEKCSWVFPRPSIYRLQLRMGA